MLQELGFEKQSKRNTSFDDLFSGAVAGGVSTAISHPLDTLATSAQAKGKFKKINTRGWRKKRILKHIKPAANLWNKRVGRYYSGMGAKQLKIIPTAAISFATYGGMKKILKNFDKKYTETTL